ncbi:MAG: fimbria/pilus outer membrane usher protein [Burkholderiaceae bacterium]
MGIRRLARRVSAWVCAAVLCAGAAWAQTPVQDEILILDVTVNGEHLGAEQEVGRSGDGRWSIPPALWSRLRWRAPTVLVQGGVLAGHAWLDQIDGLQVRFDPARQSLAIHAPADAFTTHHVDPAGDHAAIAPAGSGTGAYANYEWHAGHADGQTSWSGGVEVVGFAPGARLTTSAYYRDQSMGRGRWVRLDTGVEFSDVPSMRSLRIGDQVSSAGLWGRPVRIGGIGLGTRFSMQPGFVPFAMPSVRGEAVLPSTIDVLVNQSVVATAQVPAGPFEWNQLPTLTGRGDLRLSVTDLMGRTTEVVQPYLVSDQLLRPGLADYAFEFGRIREDYGYHSGHYGRHVLLGQYRRGVSDDVTAELRLEKLAHQRTAGAGVVWKVGGWGLAQASAAASERDGQAGRAGTVGLDVPGRALSLQLRAARSSRGFVQLGADQPDAVARSTDRVGVIMPWSRGGVALTWMQRRFWNADPQRFWILSASASFGNRFFLSAYLQSAHVERSQRSIGLQLVWPLGPRSQVWAQGARQTDRSTGGLGWVSSLPSGPGWGHRLYADADGRLAARLERRAAWADWRADLDTRSDATYVGTGMSGSLVLMGGQLRLARLIEGSFAVVRVGDVAGIPVYRDQHEIGVTDEDGVVVLNDLRPYQVNRIHVDPNDLPLDAAFDTLQLKLSPALGAGVYADLGVRVAQSMTMRLLGADRRVLPPGTVVRVRGRDQERTVGYDGRLFEPDWSAGLEYEVSAGGRSCRYGYKGSATPDEPGVPVTVECVEASP